MIQTNVFKSWLFVRNVAYCLVSKPYISRVPITFQGNYYVFNPLWMTLKDYWTNLISSTLQFLAAFNLLAANTNHQPMICCQKLGYIRCMIGTGNQFLLIVLIEILKIAKIKVTHPPCPGLIGTNKEMLQSLAYYFWWCEQIDNTK